VQHLKAYGSRLPLNNTCVDPRFGVVERGSVKVVQNLTGKWATDGNYGNALKIKIDTILGIDGKNTTGPKR
jgi:hypothetical protein